LRTAYLGTSEFAAAVLRRLAASKHRPALVVTPPDRPQGRGRKVGSPPAAEAAKELGLELAQFESVNDEAALERIRAAKPEAVVVCAFGQLIKEPLLSEFPMINVHPSLLPRWRGAAPIQRAMMAGDERTGVTIMRLTEGLDSGPVALQEEVAVDPGEDFASLSARLAELGGDLLVSALDQLEQGTLEFTDQEDEGATYAEKIDRAERRLDPARPAIELERAVRALAGHVGAYLELAGGGRLGVDAATAIGEGPAPGEFAARGEELILGTAEGGLRLDTVKPPGGRAMSAKEFLRGHEPPGRAA
jgi:methionyl-tRNA formyltransferase